MDGVFKNINFDKPTSQKTNFSAIEINTTPLTKKKMATPDSVLREHGIENGYRIDSPKEKAKAMSVAFFPNELDIIERTLASDMKRSKQHYLSKSDVVRAALIAFENMPADQRIDLIIKHRGRGRR